MPSSNTARAERYDRAPLDLREEIRHLVEAGRVGEARRIVREELAKGDQASELGGWPVLLALPKAETRPKSGRGDLVANMAWLRAHRDAHRGEWVALRDGTLLDHDPSLRALRTRLKIGNFARKVLCLKVEG